MDNCRDDSTSAEPNRDRGGIPAKKKEMLTEAMVYIRRDYISACITSLIHQLAEHVKVGSYRGVEAGT